MKAASRCDLSFLKLRVALLLQLFFLCLNTASAVRADAPAQDGVIKGDVKALTASLAKLAEANPVPEDKREALEGYTQAFKSGSPRWIETVRKKFAALGKPAISSLLHLLKSDDGNISGNALICLYWIAPDETFPLLVENLDNEAPSFMDHDVLGETIGTVTWIFLHESIDHWEFANTPRRVSFPERQALMPKLKAWFEMIDHLEPLPIAEIGWQKVQVVYKKT